MKGNLRMVRRSAAAFMVALTMLVAAGTGAGAASTVSLTNYTANSLAQSLQLKVDMPLLENTPLSTLAHLNERISYSSALGQWIKTAKNPVKGDAVAQVYSGSLTPILASVLSGGDASAFKARQASTSSTDTVHTSAAKALTSNNQIARIALPDASKPIIDVGIGTQKTSAWHTATTATTKAFSSLASVDVRLNALQLNAGAAAALDSLMDTLNGTDSSDGLIDNINKQLKPLTGNLVQLNEVPDLSTVSILHVGVMESTSETVNSKIGRTLASGATELRQASAKNVLGSVKILGNLVELDAVEVSAYASLDDRGGNAVAKPVTRIVRLRVGGSDVIDLTTGTITLPTGTIQIPAELKGLLNNLVLNVAGIKIEALRNVAEKEANHAFASANSLRITVAPLTNPTNGKPVFSVVLQGPMAQAGVDTGIVSGSSNKEKVLGRKLTRTGLNDTAYLILGPMLFGAAILVRRFSLSR